MRKSILYLFIFIVSYSFGQGKWMEVNSSFPEPLKVDLIFSSGETTIFKINVNGFNMNKVQTPSGEAFTISLDNATPLIVKDALDLLKATSFIIIGNN